MFNFLNPIILFTAGAAILLPLLIHIFNRQKVKKIAFSSLLLLRSLEKTRMRRVKIMEYLLLIIRTLIILLVVAAFARPAIRGGFATKVGAHAKTSVVILLDNSYSMGYEAREGQLFELAKKKAKEILRQLKEGDQASLILFASQPRIKTPDPTYDFKHLIEYLNEEATLSAEKTDVGQALKTAYQILQTSKNLNREIYLITDMDKSGWSSVSLELLRPESQEIKLYLVDVSPPQRENLGIKEIGFGNQLIQKGCPFQITAKIANFSSRPARDLLVGLYLDGKRVSQTDVNVEKGGETTAKFMPTVEEAGVHSGFFELTDDDLLIDNRRFFTFRIPKKIAVLLIGETRRQTRYLALALNPLGRTETDKELTRVSKSSLSGIDFSKYDVVILSDLSRLTEIQLANLKRFVQRGGGVFFILGDNIDPEFYSKEILKGLFNLNLKDPLTPTKNVGGFFSFEKIDLEHPIFQVYRNVKKEKLPLIKFSSIFELPESREVKTIVRFNLGRPALLEKSFGAGKALLLAAPVEETQTDLVRHPFFVPFINRSVGYLASDLIRLNEEIPVGSKVTRELPPDLAGGKLLLFDPHMRRIQLQPSFQTDKLIIRIDDTFLPGIYDIRMPIPSSTRGELVDQFAVNLDPQDSDPEKIELSDVEKKLGGLYFYYIKPGDDLKKSILQSRYGKELWKTLLWIAAVLLILEMFLSRSRKKDMVSEEKD